MSPLHRIRLLLLSHNFHVGGAERHTLELAKRLSRDRFETFLAHIKPEVTLLSSPRFADCKAFDCRGTHWLDISAARRLAGFIDQNGIESVLCSSFYAAMIAMLARHFARRRFSISVVYHSTVLRTLKERAQMRFYMTMLDQIDLIVFICNNQRAHWISSGHPMPKREATIHNGIDVSYFAPEAVPPGAASRFRAEAGFASTDYVVGICAALRPEKAHLDVLRAMQILRLSHPNAKLLIIGDGPERRSIEATIEREALGAHVFITGYQIDVRPWISACDVMVLASTAIETLSLAALESMALEKPLVMTDIGGASEQITPGLNGFLVQPRDTESLTRHLHTLTSTELRLSLGREARAMVESRFDIRHMVATYEDEMAKLSASPSGLCEDRLPT